MEGSKLSSKRSKKNEICSAFFSEKFVIIAEIFSLNAESSNITTRSPQLFETNSHNSYQERRSLQHSRRIISHSETVRQLPQTETQHFKPNSFEVYSLRDPQRETSRISTSSGERQRSEVSRFSKSGRSSTEQRRQIVGIFSLV